jgi:hypothetical protein
MSTTFRNALNLQQQASPGNPPSGYTKLFFKSGDLLFVRSSAGVERQITPTIVFTFSYTGTLAVTTGAHRFYNDTGATLTIQGVRISVGTAPTGAAILCDFNIDGTTIFSTQANRPSIAISASPPTSGKVTNMNTTTIANGSYFSVDIDQVGSTIPGANLTAQIVCG